MSIPPIQPPGPWPEKSAWLPHLSQPVDSAEPDERVTLSVLIIQLNALSRRTRRLPRNVIPDHSGYAGSGMPPDHDVVTDLQIQFSIADLRWQRLFRAYGIERSVRLRRGTTRGLQFEVESEICDERVVAWSEENRRTGEGTDAAPEPLARHRLLCMFWTSDRARPHA